MKYNQDILDDIMADAMHGFSVSDIANRLGISPTALLADYNDAETQVKLYYDSGRSKGKIETDKALYELAKSGSSAAKKEYDAKITDAALSNKILEILNS